MAEVLQPLMPTSSAPTMIQSRPSAETFSNMAGSPSFQAPPRSSSQSPHAAFNSPVGMLTGQRSTSAAPIQPYAFKATPHLRAETRTHSAPVIPTIDSPQSVSTPTLGTLSKQTSAGSAQLHSPKSPASANHTTKTLASTEPISIDRPASMINLSSSVPDLTLTNFDLTPKSSPNRYRNSPQRANSSHDLALPHSPATGTPTAEADHAVVDQAYASPSPSPSRAESAKSPEAAKRYRRRSSNTLEAATSTASVQNVDGHRMSVVSSKQSAAASSIRPVGGHARTPSATSSHSRSHSMQSVEDAESIHRRGSPTSSCRSHQRRDASPVRGPPVRNHADPQKRTSSPSPLSQIPYNTPQRQQTPSISVENKQSTPQPPAIASPAAQQLAALSDKDLNKGMKSRLRRAFSFGSAAELRKASAGSENASPVRQRTNLPSIEADYDEEQAEIARRQEAAGIGEGIYSGQARFNGSVDNLSISSTASSASLMLRKMGTKMKKSGRSMKGLFRPKSVIGVPAADGPIEPSRAEVSMVTVEAERQRINVNAHVSDQSDGGTGFPKLENNSLEGHQPTPDSVRGREVQSPSQEDIAAHRRSIVGTDNERAEVLAAVRKGILKRSATSSPVGSPQLRPQIVTKDLQAPGSPASSMRDERQSHSLTSTSSDYFNPRGNNNSGRSMPPTPVSSRNITFSPRIQFYDVWSSNEYDRRGDVATCNRLTPMLAQQIKEELNTLKMEMEVHELSRAHTHFF